MLVEVFVLFGAILFVFGWVWFFNRLNLIVFPIKSCAATSTEGLDCERPPCHEGAHHATKRIRKKDVKQYPLEFVYRHGPYYHAIVVWWDGE